MRSDMSNRTRFGSQDDCAKSDLACLWCAWGSHGSTDSHIVKSVSLRL